MKKHLLMKTLLVALVCLVGGTSSVWADPIETVGSTSSGWWVDFSSTYTLEGYGKYHFQFTTTNANDGNGYKTWLLVATDGNDSHGGGGTEYFVWRGDSYAWGQTKNSNDNSTLLACSNTYSGENMQAAMNGASVDLIVTRESNNIYATATITPTNGDSEFTMSFSYLFGNATSANIGLFLTVQNAQVVLNTAEQTSKWTTVWTTDFSSAPTGMTYSVTNGSTNITSGYLELAQSGNGDRAMNIAFTDTKFNVDTDWIMEFDWSCGLSNQNTSTGTFATDQGTAFVVSWGNNGTTATIKDASENTLTSILPPSGYNTSTMSKRARFTVKGVAGDGIYLTVSQEGTTYVNNVKVSSTFGYPKTFNGTVARAVSRMFLDNIVFKTPAVAGFVATPTSEITGAAGTSRKFTLSCLTDGATIYYATTDLEKGAAGWETYTGEVTTAAATIYAYAKKGDDTSDKMNFATGAGTTVNLAAATVTHSNNGVYTIASDQSAILGAPTATIHYQIDGGSEQTSTNASVNVDINADGTLTYWLTADGYGATAHADETVYAAVGYAVTRTIDFKTSNTNEFAVKGDATTITGDTHTYYLYKDQGNNLIAEDILATSFENDASSWRIQRYYGGTSPYANTEYIALKNLAAGQIVQFACNAAPSIVSNLTVVPATTYTGTYTYTATAAGDVIVSLGKGVILTTIKLCATSVPVTVSDAGFATYVPSYALDFSATSIEAYKVKVTAKGVATLTKVNNVPAGTPVLLYKDGGKTEDIPVMTGAAPVSDNDLVAGTGAAVATIDGEYTNMILNKVGGNVGFYLANDQEVATNRAYLHFATSLAPAAARMTMIFEDDDVTGVNEVRSQKEDVRSEWFDLQGRKVAQPAKGLYIVNGRKVVVK